MSSPSKADEFGALACSFCGRVRSVIAGLGGRLFANPQRKNVAICTWCVRRAAKDELFVAACKGCTPVKGRHSPCCELKETAQ